ncbi:MAG: Ppx/GppA family phosphatase [Geodermatophilaceae bacterium]|nr:Ppx/GppA family phosphatase [Geodermatophilaceae bacterium]
MPRVAAIDCGTNSVRLLISDLGVAGNDPVPPSDVLRRMEIVRLGAGVDKSGELASEAIERTRVVLESYAAQIADLGAERVRMVATSATRDARNRADFEDMVTDVLGAPAEIITGTEEAALSFLGATASLSTLTDPPAPPYLVVDIGGGSTEFVLGADTVTASLSVDIGCVRLTERHLATDPPTPDEIGAAESDIRVALRAVAESVPILAPLTLIGLAGSVTTVAAVALRLPAYDPVAIHQCRIPVGAVRSTTAGLLTMNRSQRAELSVIHPGRVDVIGAGALILRVVMDAWEIDSVLVSEHDILDGIVASLADPR